MQTNHLTHKHGGKITAIKAVAHVTIKGVASWHFVGTVEWNDGSGDGKDYEIAPWCICYDQDNPEANAEGTRVFEAMTAYLNECGTWHDAKFKRDGRTYSWTPTEKAGSREVQS